MLTFIYSDVLIFYKMNPICLNVYVQYITFVFNYFSFILELLFNYIYYLTIFLLLINYKEEIIWHVNHMNTFDYQLIIILIYNWIPHGARVYCTCVICRKQELSKKPAVDYLCLYHQRKYIDFSSFISFSNSLPIVRLFLLLLLVLQYLVQL